MCSIVQDNSFYNQFNIPNNLESCYVFHQAHAAEQSIAAVLVCVGCELFACNGGSSMVYK